MEDRVGASDTGREILHDDRFGTALMISAMQHAYSCNQSSADYGIEKDNR